MQKFFLKKSLSSIFPNYTAECLRNFFSTLLSSNLLSIPYTPYTPLLSLHSTCSSPLLSPPLPIPLFSFPHSSTPHSSPLLSSLFLSSDPRTLILIVILTSLHRKQSTELYLEMYYCRSIKRILFNFSSSLFSFSLF